MLAMIKNRQRRLWAAAAMRAAEMALRIMECDCGGRGWE